MGHRSIRRASKILLGVAMVVGVTFPTYSQDVPPSPQQPRQVTPMAVIEPTQEPRPFNKVIYVLDVSGSMQGILSQAIRATDCFMSDGFMAAVVTFTVSFTRWHGVEEPCEHPPTEPCNDHCLPAGWCWMPKHRDALMSYLESLGGDGDTDPSKAIEYAVSQAPADCLIVFISDGVFDCSSSVNALKRGLERRKQANAAPVQMLVWATSPFSSSRESMIELARLGGGGLWRAETHEPSNQPDADLFMPW